MTIRRKPLYQRATDVRLKDPPSYGVYVYAKTQLEEMLKLLTAAVPITPAQKKFVEIGLMPAKELWTPTAVVND